MADLNLSSASLLSLLQWCDSLFPSGAFSHSFGLESAVHTGKVRNGTDLLAWIRAKLIHQIFPCDCVFLIAAHRAGIANDLASIQKHAAKAYAMRIPREIREGGRMVAARLIQTAAELYPMPWTQACEQLHSTGKLKGDPAIAFGIAAAAAEIPILAARLGYLYLFISAQVSSALRLIPIGQQEGQEIIHTTLNWAEKREEMHRSDFFSDRNPSAFMPASEIRSMQHECSEVRLFQS